MLLKNYNILLSLLFILKITYFTNLYSEDAVKPKEKYRSVYGGLAKDQCEQFPDGTIISSNRYVDRVRKLQLILNKDYRLFMELFEACKKSEIKKNKKLDKKLNLYELEKDIRTCNVLLLGVLVSPDGEVVTVNRVPLEDAK